jgi:arylsulfatase A-like enzyme
LADLAPTILELLSLAPPPSFQGRSLVSLLRGSSLPRAAVFAETSVGGDPRRRKIAVRHGMLKLLGRNRMTGGAELSRLELFDLARDADEQHPLPHAARHALARQAAAYLRRAMDGAARSEPVTLDPKILEELRAFGYVQ